MMLLNKGVDIIKVLCKKLGDEVYRKTIYKIVRKLLPKRFHCFVVIVVIRKTFIQLATKIICLAPKIIESLFTNNPFILPEIMSENSVKCF